MPKDSYPMPRISTLISPQKTFMPASVPRDLYGFRDVTSRFLEDRALEEIIAVGQPRPVDLYGTMVELAIYALCEEQRRPVQLISIEKH